MTATPEQSLLLALLVAVPLAAALFIGLAALVTRSGEARLRAARRLSGSAIAAEVVLAIVALVRFDPQHAGAQLQLNMPGFELGVDGLSLALVVTSAVGLALTIGAALLGRTGAPALRAALPGDFALFLLSGAGAQLLLVAQGGWPLLAGWLLLLLPAVFVLARWGGALRQLAALRLLLATVAGALALGFALAWLGESHHTGSAWIPWSCVLVACALIAPLVPFHTWLPEAHAEAATPVSVLLAGMPTKAGLYVFLRLAFAHFPTQTHEAAPSLAAGGALTLVWAALATLGQTDLKRLAAYASVARAGLALVAMASLTPQGMEGALVLLVADALVAPLLVLSVGALSERAHHRHVEGFGGLILQLPEYGVVASVAWVAAMGTPGLVAGAGDLLGIGGSLGTFPRMGVISATGAALLAASLLWVLQRLLFGPLNARYKRLADLTTRERLLLHPLAVLVVLLGLFPQPLLVLGREALVQLAAGVAQH